MFFFLLVLKFGVLAYLMDDMLSEQLRERYQFDLALVTVGMIGAIMLTVLLATVMAGQQIVQAARVPTIRLQITKAAPDLPLSKEHTWHMFLSHIWGTGQVLMPRAHALICRFHRTGA